MSEFTEQFYCPRVVCPGGVLHGIKPTYIDGAPAEHYFAHPFVTRFVPRHSFKSTAIVGRDSQVPLVLGTRAFPEITPTIVESIVVFVVCLFLGCLTANDQSMHVRVGSVDATGGVELSIRTNSLPVPPIQPFVIDAVHDGITSTRESNQAIRWVRWLGDIVSKHTAFLHKSSVKGFVLLSHFNTHAVDAIAGGYFE